MELIECTERGSRSKEARKPKVILKGELVYSFGKNGQGLSDEFLKIGQLINMLSDENRIYLTESFVDSPDDVYDMRFSVTPKDENVWVFKHNFTTGGPNKKEPTEPESAVPYNPAEYGLNGKSKIDVDPKV